MRDSTAIFMRALFLACSWTWCIGMWLPVYLIRDFGYAGWVVFAIPNVLGAAAMGLVLSAPGASASLVRNHAPAMLAFSIVTALFHAYFLGHISTIAMPALPPLGEATTPIVACLLAVALVAAFRLMRTRGWMITSVVVFAISLACAALAWRTTGGNALQLPHHTGVYERADLLWAAPALFFGFALCPYLDLTFHRTRQETPGDIGSAAFILGFCGFFLIMIVFTLFYSFAFILTSWVSYYLGLHMLMQSVFTVGAHAREWRERLPALSRLATITTLLSAAALFALGAMTVRPSGFRLGYELFLSFYGLAFPAYVWIVMIPRPRLHAPAPLVWIVSVALATPLFAAGYMGRMWILLPVAVAVPLLAPLAASVLPRTRRESRAG